MQQQAACGSSSSMQRHQHAVAVAVVGGRVVHLLPVTFRVSISVQPERHSWAERAGLGNTALAGNKVNGAATCAILWRARPPSA